MAITYNWLYVAGYDFNTENITESNIREIIKRHYDFIKWCENNATEPYYVNPYYSPDGLTVSFRSESDLCLFIDFLSNYHELFLHN